jgi:hypothetical protein
LKDILGAVQDASANMREELDSMKGAIFMNTTNVDMLRQQQFATHVAVGKNTASVTRLTKENTVLHQKLATLVKQLEGIQQQIGQTMAQQQMMQQQYGQTVAQQQMMQQQYGQTMAQQRILPQRQQLIQEIFGKQPSPGYYYSKNCTVYATLREPNPDPKSLREAWTMYYWLQSLPASPGKTYRGINIQGCAPDEPWLKVLLTQDAVFKDQGFTSTSRSVSVAKHFAELDNGSGVPPYPLFLVMEHTSGRLINGHVAKQYEWAEEMCFLPQTLFKILRVERLFHGIQVHMSEITG